MRLRLTNISEHHSNHTMFEFTNIAVPVFPAILFSRVPSMCFDCATSCCCTASEGTLYFEYTA